MPFHTFDEMVLTVILPVPVISSTPLIIKLLVLILDATKLPVTIALLLTFKVPFSTSMPLLITNLSLPEL